MNVSSIARKRTRHIAAEIPFLNSAFLRRAYLAASFVILAYQFQWDWLRFLISEAILRISAWAGMTTARTSFDTIELQGQAFRIVVACTFVDVIVGTVVLMWRLPTSPFKNVLQSVHLAGALFAFNIVRLEIGHILYVHRVPWILAHDALGGLAYFGIWLVIWRRQEWRAITAAQMEH